MKNLGTLILGIIIGGLIMYFYTQNEEKETSVMKVMSDRQVQRPNGLISPNEARTLDQAYNERYNIINDSLFKNAKTEDNRSSWYKLEDIENYLIYAKQQAHNDGFTMNGLRLYLGAYPDDNGEKGLTTLFFIPTGYKNVAKGSMFSLQDDGGDLTKSDGLNLGGGGMPPRANYPQ